MFFFLGRNGQEAREQRRQTWPLPQPAIAILVSSMILWRRASSSLGLVALVVVAVLRYLCFQFRVEEQGVLIRQGVLLGTQLDMRFDRIQGITTAVAETFYRRARPRYGSLHDGGGRRGRGPSLVVCAGGDARVRGAAARPAVDARPVHREDCGGERGGERCSSSAVAR